MSEPRLKIAVFIDFDNVEIGVKTTLGLQFDVGAVLEAIKERGEIITKVAYGDWKRAGDHSRAMAQHAVRLVQRVMTPGGDKNGADINLALDALEMGFTHDHINAFVIVGGDSDFITLVEKLKQYDKKVFVVGGRAFTSQVMQKNCTEFIAYENVAGKGAAPRSERGRAAGFASQSLEQAVPLVKRALKVLTDREVSPQLGLLKSTLLQLDSSFSERDYGASTFRDFAEKLEKRGLVSLKHSGRTTLVELAEGESLDASGDSTSPSPRIENVPLGPRSIEDRRMPRAGGGDLRGLHAGSEGESRGAARTGDEDSRADADRSEAQEPVTELTLADGVALVRQVLAESEVPPRWPMYLRQMKQFLRNARPDFDERRYGSLQDLLRACQKAGLVRLERDRQGGLRAFAGAVKPYVPAGWVAPETETAADVQEATSAAVDGVVVTEGDVAATTSVLSHDVAPAGEMPVYASDEAISSSQPGTDVEDAEGAEIVDAHSAGGPAAADPDTYAASASALDDPRDEDEDATEDADDQLAMFGIVRPTDPEPVKARRSAKTPTRARKTATPAGRGDKPRRTRKTPATRTPSRRNRS
jgi:uncharacterized LabA/DUF88 family protein